MIKPVVLHKNLPTGRVLLICLSKSKNIYFLLKEYNSGNSWSNIRRNQIKHITTRIIQHILNLLETLECMARSTGQHLAPAWGFGEEFFFTSGQTRALYAVLAPLGNFLVLSCKPSNFM